MTDDEAIHFFTTLLEIPSETDHEAPAVDYLVRHLAEHGLATHSDEAGNAVAETKRTQDRQLIFLGHIDTVPGQIRVRQENGWIYGRGAVDAKGPLAAAAVAATRSGNTANLRVVGAVGEEGPSNGARQLLSQTPPGALIIGEPGGADSIVLGYRGSMRATFHYTFPTGHSAGPNATVCDTAVQSWQRVKEYCASVNPDARTFDSLSPALLDFASSSDGLEQCAALHANFRLPPGVDVERAKEGIDSAAAASAVEFGETLPAFQAPKSSPLVSSFIRSLRADEIAPRFKYKTGTSDMNLVAPVWNCPTVAYGPGDSTLDHTPNEHIAIDEFLRAVRVLTRVFQEWQ